MKKLLCFALILILAGCGSPAIESAVSSYQLVRVSDDFAVGSPRVSFGLLDGTEPADDVSSITLAAFPIDGDSDGDPVWSGEALTYTAGDVPYWVGYPDIPAAGFWGLAATLTKVDGSVETAEFVIEVREASLSVALDAPVPETESATVDSVAEEALLTSDGKPNLELYRLSVADALQNGRPTIVGFITPAFCETRWCTPVYETLSVAEAQFGDEANFIHIEVYDMEAYRADFETLTWGAAMGEWGLQSEPWLMVIDENGRLSAKLSGPVALEELRLDIEEVLANE